MCNSSMLANAGAGYKSGRTGHGSGLRQGLQQLTATHINS